MSDIINTIVGTASSPVVDAVTKINTQDAGQQFLSPEESQLATQQSKHVNGENGPDILTAQELKDADDYEIQRVLDNEDMKSIADNLESAEAGSAELRDLQRAAVNSAWNRYLVDTVGIPGGLRMADLQKYQQEAVEDGNAVATFSTKYLNAIQNFQGKTDVLRKIKSEIEKPIQARGWFSDFGAKYFQAFKDSLPLYNAALRSDYNPDSNFSDIFSPVKNTIEFNKFWANAFYSEMSPEQFEVLVRAGIASQDKFFTNKEELLRYVDMILDLDTGVAALEIGTDLAIVGGLAAKGTTGAVVGARKAGATGAALGAVRGSMPFLTPQGVKGVVRTTDKGIKTLKKAGEAITEKITRKRFVGNVKSASEDAAKIVKDIPLPKDKLALTEPDLVNTVIRDDLGNVVAVQRTVFDDVIGDAVDTGESVLPSTASTEKVLSERALRRTVQALKRTLDEGADDMTPEGLQRSLLSDPAVYYKALLGLTDRFSTKDLGLSLKVGETSKAISLYDFASELTKTPVNELAMDMNDDLIVRFKYPKTFSTPQHAANFAEKLNKDFLYDFNITPLKDGTASLDIDMKLNKGFGILLKESTEEKRGTWTSRAKSAIFTITGTPDTVRQLEYLTDTAAQKIRESGDALLKDIKKLSKSQKKDLNMILEATINPDQPTWFKPETLLAKGFDDKVVNAYSKARILSDMTFLVMNNARRTQMNRVGLKTITLNGEKIGYGRLIRPSDPDGALELLRKSDRYLAIEGIEGEPLRYSELAQLSEQTSYDYVMNASETRAGRVLDTYSAEQRAKTKRIYDEAIHGLKKGDYVILETQFSPDGRIKAGDIYQLVPKNAVVESELPAIVMSYVPGWRRYFDRSAVYVKQARTRGRQVVGVNTIMSGTEAWEITENVEKLNKIVKAIAEDSWKVGQAAKESDLTVTALIRKLEIPFAPFNDAASFKKWASTVGIDLTNPDNPLEIVKNNALPTVFKKGGFFKFDFMSKDAIEAHRYGSAYEALISESELYKMNRSGGTILNYDFTPRAIVDADQTIKYMINDMVSYGVMSRFDEFYLNRFAKDFKPVLDKIAGAHTMDAAQLISADLGKLKKSLKNVKEREMVEQAMTAQSNFLVLKGYGSPLDQYVADQAEVFLNWMRSSADAMHIPKWLQAGVRIPYQKIMKWEPSKKAMAFTSHTALGMWNISQLTKNFLGPVAIGILPAEPLHGTAALKDLACLRLWGLGKRSPKLMKKLEKVAKMEDIDLKKIDIIRYNMSLMDTKTSGILGGAILPESNSSTFAQISMWFFNKADSWNRLVAADTALRALGFADRKITDPKDLARVGSYADTLYMNMGRRGLSRLQSTDVAKLVLQFQGYTLRTAETILGDAQLSKRQKMLMLLSQLTLAGGAGTIGAEAYNALANKIGLDTDYDDSTVTRIIKEAAEIGLSDTALKEAGIDLSFRGFFSPTIVDTMVDITEAGIFGAFRAAPVVRTVKNLADAVIYTGQFMWNKYGGDYSYLEWSELMNVLLKEKKLPSSANKLDTAFTMLETGNRFNSKSQLVSTDNDKLQALLTVLGADSQSAYEIYMSNYRQQLARDEYDEVSKKAQPLANEAAKGNKTADLLMRLTIGSSGLTDYQKHQATLRAMKGVVENNMVPLTFRENLDSMKSFIKLDDTTYKY